jgi:hypothetical protein
VLAITLLAYAAQLGLGVQLLVDSHDSDQLINLSIVLFVTLIVSLQRASSLLKGKHLAGGGGTAVTGAHDPPPGPEPGQWQPAAPGIGRGLGTSEDLPSARRWRLFVFFLRFSCSLPAVAITRARPQFASTGVSRASSTADRYNRARTADQTGRKSCGRSHGHGPLRWASG